MYFKLTWLEKYDYKVHIIDTGAFLIPKIKAWTINKPLPFYPN